MILTQCAVCATELGLSLGKKCGRCSTRYCGAECQKQHWEESGHDKLCKRIKKAGGAEQYNANKRYTEAVAVAVEKCADDTKGQTCYICTQALHWKTKEGLVRMCSCRGTSGFAHVSCLAEEARILFAEAEENNLDNNAKQARWDRWDTCSLCKQPHHGLVMCALGWACWKTYLGRPETDRPRLMAMNWLGNGLLAVGHNEDALSVQETELAMKRRLGLSEASIFVAQSNLARTYMALGRVEEALQLERDVYNGSLRLLGEEDEGTLISASNYADSLNGLKRFEESKSLLRRHMPVARRVLGDSNDLTLKMRKIYANVLCDDPGATIDDIREAVTTLEDMEPTVRRLHGGAHPHTVALGLRVQLARSVLRARETPPAQADAIDAMRSIREAVEAMTSGLDGKLVLDDATTQGHEGDA
jgi:hypothetical protein